MGQYYEIINITKKEIIDSKASGWKLMEFSYVGNHKTDQLWVALSDEWKNDTVLVCGDYYSSEGGASCNPCGADMEQLAGVEPGCLCDYADENYKECDFDTAKVPNYAVNPIKKQYVDRNHVQLNDWYTEGDEKKATTYGYFIDPLALLLAAGNGQGGGDYRGNNIDLVGSWVKDSQAVYTVYQKSEIPADYTELIPDFIEDRYSNVPNLRKDDPALKEFFAEKAEEFKKKKHALNSLSDGGMNASMETLVRELGKYLKKQMIQFDNSNMIKKELDIFTTMNHLKNISFDYYSSYGFDCEKPGLTIYAEIPMEYGTPYNVSLAHIIFSKRKTGELYNVLDVGYSIYNKDLSIQDSIDYVADSCNAKITEENKRRKTMLDEVINKLKIKHQNSRLKNMAVLKCASFFAGVGGIDIGFEGFGSHKSNRYRVVYANEIDSYPVRTYELNSSIKVDHRNISDVRPEDVPKADVYFMGFPCTDISIAGLQKGLFDENGDLTRSGLFFECVRLIHYNKPKIVFVENVKNLLSHNNGETFKAIKESLENEGYHLKYKVLNAMEYGNVPQNRERIYIVAFRDEKLAGAFEFPKPIPLTTKLSDIIDFHTKLDDKYYYTPGKYKGDIYDKLKEVMDDPNTVYQWRRKYVRKNMSGVVPTLTANQGESGHNVCLVLTDNGIRKMTPKECFNAQGFPADFKLPDDIAESRLYKQAGNSVCVTVISRIAKKITEAVDTVAAEEDNGKREACIM